MDLQTLCRQLDYQFEKQGLLRQALTHRSHGAPNNERLEFLGDSVLSVAIATHLYHTFPSLSEGELSRLRAHLVKAPTLSGIAFSLQLGEYLFLGEGELKSGGFRRPSILADTLEAIIGAIYLDGGFAAAEHVVGKLYASLLQDLDPKSLGKDPKTQLQEYLQSRKIALPQYVVVATLGEAHEQQFQVECLIPELDIRAVGEGASRRSAEQGAAKSAYQMACGQ